MTSQGASRRHRLGAGHRAQRHLLGTEVRPGRLVCGQPRLLICPQNSVVGRAQSAAPRGRQPGGTGDGGEVQRHEQRISTSSLSVRVVMDRCRSPQLHRRLCHPGRGHGCWRQRLLTRRCILPQRRGVAKNRSANRSCLSSASRRRAHPPQTDSESGAARRCAGVGHRAADQS